MTAQAEQDQVVSMYLNDTEPALNSFNVHKERHFSVCANIKVALSVQNIAENTPGKNTERQVTMDMLLPETLPFLPTTKKLHTLPSYFSAPRNRDTTSRLVLLQLSELESFFRSLKAWIFFQVFTILVLRHRHAKDTQSRSAPNIRDIGGMEIHPLTLLLAGKVLSV